MLNIETVLTTSMIDDKRRLQILEDYRICCLSREVSFLARKEVLTGKAKFGISGDGKEVPQVVMARMFEKGDFRAGYYRDQTVMFALGLCTVEQFFAQLYADPENDPFSGGRQMNAHFATALIDEKGDWISHTDKYNVTSGISATASQMARALGLAFASKKYRESEELSKRTDFSNNGNEVCFCTIGDASTSEGAFWETINAAGVLQVPLSISVWDDGYGISVPTKYQTTKGSISAAAMGFQAEDGTNGINVYTAYAWDYPTLVEIYTEGIKEVRSNYRPALFHIKECTQPQGHSTSGSHERYKSKERLDWEADYDCIKKMGEWMVEEGIAIEAELIAIREEAKRQVIEEKNKAWKKFRKSIRREINTLNSIYTELIQESAKGYEVADFQRELNQLMNPTRKELVELVKQTLRLLKTERTTAQGSLERWLKGIYQKADDFYHSHLYSHSKDAAVNVEEVKPTYNEDAPYLNGFEIINQFFDKKLEQLPELFAFGEDVGQIGDVNQGFAGMQAKYGEERVFDTGIREWTIMGQGLGMAMRGLRPIAEIQYLDYLVYGLVPLTDDLACLRYRSKGLHKAPMIIRTRGHRLEGIWHTGSPMGLILNSLRGVYVLTPRNFTQAAGLYNTMLQSDDPAILIECLNGYRLKEQLPSNMGEYTVPLGVPEVLQEGNDITLVTYGSCVRIAEKGIEYLKEVGISVELIDVQTLLPFDIHHRIVESVKKTNRVVFMDEDLPGAATAFMLQEVLEKQKAYRYLDAQPVTISAYAHRPPYGSDGDYFTKPNADTVFEKLYEIMHEADPQQYPKLYDIV